MTEFNINRSIGIAITEYNSLSKCISIIRKYRNCSMAEIKSEIDSKDFVFVCDYTDTEELNKLIECHDELANEGCLLIIQEQDRPITRTILQNLKEMHDAIHEETMSMIDMEVGEDNNDLLN